MEQFAGSGLLFGISGTVQKVAEDGTVCAIIYQLTKQLTAIILRVSLFAFSLCSVIWNFFVLMPR